MSYYSKNSAQRTRSGGMTLNSPKLTTNIEQMQGGMGSQNLMSLFQPQTGGQIQTQRMTRHGGQLMNFLKSFSSAEKPRFNSKWITSGNLWKY